MVSSDEEADDVLKSVSNYHFVDETDDLISFSVLPFRRRSPVEAETETGRRVFLCGKSDDGLNSVYKQVKAWKFDLKKRQPLVSVLTKENHWVLLQKPRKSFEETVKSVLVTVHCLHFARRNPETSGKTLWDHLRETFSSYEVKPSQNDLLDHIQLLSEAVERDDSLAKCQFLLNLIREKPRKSVPSEEDAQASKASSFIVDDDVEDFVAEGAGESESDEEDDLFDSVCAICDNGGNLICCDGRCMRSFHSSVKDGKESRCDSLGLTKEEVDAPIFMCENCKYNQHQCFACGKLGSSDKTAGAEVIQCANGTCGYYYHPRCIAKLICAEDDVATMEMEKKIADGESFTCSIHKCCICKQVENKKEHDLQFAVCRRCPTAYHRKCLPRDICTDEEVEGDIVTRAWDNLLPNRLLIYCLKHDIIEKIGTPMRNHIKFPGDEEEKRKKRIIREPEGKEFSKKRIRTTEDSFSEKSTYKSSKDLYSTTSKVKVTANEPDSISKVRRNDPSRPSLKGNKGMVLPKSNSGTKDRPDRQLSTLTKTQNSEVLDPDSERRILALIKDAESSITLNDVILKKEVPSTHSYSSRNTVDKTMSLGKIEGAVEAVRTALKKLDNGCSIEDAKAVCPPEVLHQVFKWKNKLKMHLGPVLHGMRYTSYGRHFTKIEKLQEIVDMLHLYAVDGDMIVDFCCGANDFSCLMKKKLEETGKKCSYKNFDIFQPKNDFNFEKRDWFSVGRKDLPSGSQLIMGLNPPFGVKASLANRFIDKALEFQPKLLILIVPPETKRLDDTNRKMKTPYDLVWEDDHFCSGKSFYLPGSIDENDKQMDQWNLIAPPLYLWSRSDFSAKHKSIAQKHGHVSKQRGETILEDDKLETEHPDHPVEDYSDNANVSMLAEQNPIKNMEPEKAIRNSCGHKRGNLPHAEGDRESEDSHRSEKSQPTETSRSKKHSGKHGEGSHEDHSDNASVSMLAEQNPIKNMEPEKAIRNSYGRNRGNLPHTEGDRESQDSHRAGKSQPTETSRNKKHSGKHGEGSHEKLQDDRVDRERCQFFADNDASFGYRSRMPEHVWEPGVQPQVPSYTQAPLYPPYDPVHHYGQFPNPSARGNYVDNRDFGFGSPPPSLSNTYGHLDVAPDSSYRMNEFSAMQRYAPRLDELNHTLGPEPPMFNGNGFYDARAPTPQPGYHGDPRAPIPQPGYHGDPRAPQPGYHPGAPIPQPGYHPGAPTPQPGYHPRAPIPQPGYHGDPITYGPGFVPAPQPSFAPPFPSSTQPYSHNSAGWVDD